MADENTFQKAGTCSRALGIIRHAKEEKFDLRSSTKAVRYGYRMADADAAGFIDTQYDETH